MYICMPNTKLIEMREQVKKEIEHIKRGDIYQNLLRQTYASLRMASLGKKAKYPNDKNEILKLSIQNMKEYAKKKDVNFKPEYDKNYFKI